MCFAYWIYVEYKVYGWDDIEDSILTRLYKLLCPRNSQLEEEDTCLSPVAANNLLVFGGPAGRGGVKLQAKERHVKEIVKHNVTAYQNLSIRGVHRLCIANTLASILFAYVL